MQSRDLLLVIGMFKVIFVAMGIIMMMMMMTMVMVTIMIIVKVTWRRFLEVGSGQEAAPPVASADLDRPAGHASRVHLRLTCGTRGPVLARPHVRRAC